MNILGSLHSLQILSFRCKDDDSLKCWGSGSYGRLGQGSVEHIGDNPGEMGDSLPPVDLGAGRTVAPAAKLLALPASAVLYYTSFPIESIEVQRPIRFRFHLLTVCFCNRLRCLVVFI